YSAEGFVDRVITFAKQFDIEPRSIIFEITEDVVPSSIDNVVDVMHRLTQYGFRFSIDDFGTGYSSLRYLKNLPLGELKIDKSFVDDVTAEGRAAAIVKTIIDMAHNFNLDVVAEGVESEEQLNILAKYQCELYQGFFFWLFPKWSG
ncbi:EAL domain-containing protein, partial [Thiolapillus sp.]